VGAGRILSTIDRPSFPSPKIAVFIQKHLKRFFKANEPFKPVRVSGFMGQDMEYVGEPPHNL